jgi:phage terminase large subunit
MTSAQIAIPEKLIELFSGEADVRAAHGGRGSGKTRSFATMAAIKGYQYGMAGISGIILCARQFMNSLADSSLEEMKRAIEDVPFLRAYYEFGETFIRSRDGRIDFAFAGLDRNIASIKSKGRLLLCWVDEAEPVTETAWQTLIPTLREEGDGWNAELWVTWNPLRKNAACEKRFRQSKDPRIKCVQINWRDNPKFPAKLERDRQRDLNENPNDYDHIWEGGYKESVEGAYFTKQLLAARQAGRIGVVAADPLMTLRAFVDIGGTGQNADSFAMWIVQFVGLQVRVLDYYEAQGQPMATHAQWLRDSGYTPDRLQIWLPHDGEKADTVFFTTPKSALESLGYHVETVPNQGKGAAMKRVEAARRLFPQIWFNQATCQGGLDALAWYQEKRDEKRSIGLGPLHDWASHGADAFGLMCCVYEPPQEMKPLSYPSIGIV